MTLAYQATPVVILSGAAKEEEEPRCLHLGATAYREKSANFYAYFAAIKAIVNTWLKPEHSQSASAKFTPKRFIEIWSVQLQPIVVQVL